MRKGKFIKIVACLFLVGFVLRLTLDIHTPAIAVVLLILMVLFFIGSKKKLGWRNNCLTSQKQKKSIMPT